MNSHFLRIWEQIINKSVDNLKKTEIELLIEEQKIQKEKLANIESTLKSIEISLSNINKWFSNKSIASWKPSNSLHLHWTLLFQGILFLLDFIQIPDHEANIVVEMGREVNCASQLLRPLALVCPCFGLPLHWFVHFSCKFHRRPKQCT